MRRCRHENSKTVNLKSGSVFCQPHPSLTFIHFETLSPVSSDSLGCHGNEAAHDDRLIFNLQFKVQSSIFSGDDGSLETCCFRTNVIKSKRSYLTSFSLCLPTADDSRLSSDFLGIDPEWRENEWMR